MRPIDKILPLLDNVISLTNGYSALCLAHDDTRNSLSVAEGDDGRVLLYCHAGCTFEEIINALGVSARSLFLRQKRA